MSYFENLIEEKNLNGITLEVEGKNGLNIIPIEVLLDYILLAPIQEQRAIKDMLVKIDFLNGNVVNYFKHLAKAIAL